MSDYYFITDHRGGKDEDSTDQSQPETTTKTTTKTKRSKGQSRKNSKPKKTKPQKDDEELTEEFIKKREKQGKIVIKNGKKTGEKSKSNARPRKIQLPMSLPKEKMTLSKKKLLDIYYKEKDECDHLWLHHPMDYLDPEFEQGEALLDNIYKTIEEFNINDKKALIVHINSGGGDADAGKMLYNLIKNIKKPTIGVIEFWCASAATYPLLACDLRISKPFSLFLIHQTRGAMVGKFKEIRRQMHEWQVMYDQNIEIYKSETKMTKDQIKHYLRSELFIDLHQLMKLGFIDHVFDRTRIPKLDVKKHMPMARPKELSFRDFAKYLRILSHPSVLIENQVSQITVITDYTAALFNHTFAMLNLMLEIPIPVNFVVPARLINGVFLMSLFADRTLLLGDQPIISMFADPIVKGGFSRQNSLEDEISNTTYYRKIIHTILKSRTKIPKKILEEMKDKSFDFQSNKALEYGMITDIINHPKSK